MAEDLNRTFFYVEIACKVEGKEIILQQNKMERSLDLSTSPQDVSDFLIIQKQYTNGTLDSFTES